MRKGLVALAVVFLAAHLPFLPPTLDDIDSINFALGVRDFDVARHQPHPPGYPLFIALGKISTPLLRAAGVSAPEAPALALWSTIAGAALILLLFAMFRALDHAGSTVAKSLTIPREYAESALAPLDTAKCQVGVRPREGGVRPREDDGRALWTTVLVALSPLYWFTALRPLSDMGGLAVAVAAQALLLTAIARSGGLPAPATGRPGGSRTLLCGAFVAGLSIGVRSQTALLTLPLLAFALVMPRLGLRTLDRMAAVAAAALGVVAWGVPLVIASGGPTAYLEALGSQGAEDFSGVLMLWTHPTHLVAAHALLNTFVLPWDSFVLAGIVLVLAAAGAVILLWRSPRVALVLGLAFLPYAAFHLLFQEFVTVRYALPLVLAVAFLAVTALVAIHRHVAAVAVIAIGAYSLVLAVPATTGFARQPSPIFGLLADMNAAAQGGIPPVVAMHRRELTETRRPREWSGGVPGRLLPAPRDYEWLEVTRWWREGGTSHLWFIAEPRRTDLALIDAHNSRTTEYRWPFRSAVYVGNPRPDEMDWHTYSQPGWFLERGWALTPEVAGITERDGWGPHRRPSVGWVRRSTSDVVLLLGGRHLGAATEPPMRAIAEIDGRAVLTTEITPGAFLMTTPLTPGVPAGDGTFAKLTVRAEPVAPGYATSPVAIEQFNLQPRGVPMLGFDEGWQEPEHNATTGRSWRWMSERAALRIVNASGDVTIRIAVENPLRYYKTPPELRVSAGTRELATFRPDRDFTYEVVVPAAALSAAGGRVTLESDQMFIPGDREGSADRRHLALRIFSSSVR